MGGSRGHEDWNRNVSAEVFAMHDLGELAVRQGSPVVHWRSGNVIYLTGFECDTNDWYPLFPWGGGGELEHFTGENISNGLQPLRGSACLRFPTATLSYGDGLYRSHAIKTLPARWYGDLGVEASMAIDVNVKGVVIDLVYDDGDTDHAAGIYIDPVNKKLLYRSTATGFTIGNFTEFADQPGDSWLTPANSNLRWLVFKMTVDSDFGEYGGLRINMHDFQADLDGKTIPSTASAAGTFERLKVQITVINTNNTQTHIYVDDVIITQDEPSR